jgi:HSP20 family molecular chaperone IbpA
MEVTNIQQIMDGIEALQNQMHEFELEIHPAVEKLEKEEKEQAEAREAEEKEKERIAKEKEEAELKTKSEEQLKLREEAEKVRRQELRKSIEIPNDEKDDEEEETETDKTAEKEEEESPWRRLKLEVDLSVTERPTGYIITGNIPGMQQKDIKIKVDNNSLIISGFREPSEADLQQMKRILSARGFQTRNPKELLGALLKISVGRFGTFQQTYKLPADGVDTSKIEAQYNHGTLRVVVPKSAPQKRPVYPQQQRAGYRPGNRPGFFQDPSVWW